MYNGADERPDVVGEFDLGRVGITWDWGQENIIIGRKRLGIEVVACDRDDRDDFRKSDGTAGDAVMGVTTDIII